jgi:hypothetical protein
MGNKKKEDRCLPADRFRTMGWIRDLKQRLMPGSQLQTQETPQLMKALQRIRIDDIQKSTISNWWNGKNVPSHSYQKPAERKFPDINQKWFVRSLNMDRTQCHLCAIDLATSHRWANSLNEEECYELAQIILMTVHRDWQPDRSGWIEIPGPAQRQGVCFQIIRFKKISDPRTAIPFTTTKGPRSQLSEEADKETRLYYKFFDTTTIIPFLLRYAATSRLPDPGLLASFTLDFTSACIACRHIIGTTWAQLYLDQCGPSVIIVQRFLELLWEPRHSAQDHDPFWIDNDPLLNFGFDISDELKITPEQLLELILRVKECYWEIMATLGVDAECLRKLLLGTQSTQTKKCRKQPPKKRVKTKK